jgi:chromosome segregation ATPase
MSANNKTVKKQPKSTSPRPVNRERFHASNHLQAVALSGNPLHSIFQSENRSQSRNNRLLTGVTEIKDECKKLHDKLGRMESVIDSFDSNGCPYVKQLKSEIEKYEETLRKVMESYTKDKERYKESFTTIKQQMDMCNKEKLEKDEKITKLKQQLELCKEKIIKKYDETVRKVNQQLEMCKKEKEEKDKIIEERDEKIKKYDEAVRKVKEAYTKDKERYEDYFTKLKKELEKCKKEKEEYKSEKSPANSESGTRVKTYKGVTYNKSRPLPSELMEYNISRRRVKHNEGNNYNYLGRSLRNKS